MNVVWAGVLAIAVLWPARALSWFDGMPLDGRAEAIVVGVAIPALLWLDRRFLERSAVRVAIGVLLAVKLAGSAILTQQGLCARFSTNTPFSTTVLTIPIDEPRGVLRSWDVRVDWRAENPTCTAIVDRPYTTESAFPAWFLNITDFASGARRAVTMDISGYARVGERGRFAIDVDRDMVVTGRIGSHDVASSSSGETLSADLDPGVHPITLHTTLVGERWRFVPRWNTRDAFQATTLTVARPRAPDRWLAATFGMLTTIVVLGLVAAWIVSVVAQYRESPMLVCWSLASAGVLAALGASGWLERLSGLLLVAAVVVPVASRHRNLRGAFLLVGVPWLAFFAVRALPQIGHFSGYSNDDWLAYQVAGYRIFMNGYWLEGGSRVFDYQPLYRWMSGLLHLVFGDSSVGEVYWDASCLLAGALASFALVKPVGGFRWAVAASAATLATFTLGTVWYFVGRGLSEVAAAGWAFLTAFLLLRARAGRLGARSSPPAREARWRPPAGPPTRLPRWGSRARAAFAAGVAAVLMFYTRLNHVMFAVFLLALLVPADTPTRWRDAIRAAFRLDLRSAAMYAGTLAAGVALFAWRTWWYTGVFSVLYGTSLKNNDTGLRLGTLASPAVWTRISHSLRALVWMNEPGSPDPRTALVVAGVVLSVLALLQAPKFNRLPLSIAVVTLGATASAFFAHTHNYPGRMSIHLAPFAMAMTACAGARLFGASRVPSRAAALEPPQAAEAAARAEAGGASGWGAGAAPGGAPTATAGLGGPGCGRGVRS